VSSDLGADDRRGLGRARFERLGVGSKVEGVFEARCDARRGNRCQFNFFDHVSSPKTELTPIFLAELTPIFLVSSPKTELTPIFLAKESK
jgi:hypothetical protein